MKCLEKHFIVLVVDMEDILHQRQIDEVEKKNGMSPVVLWHKIQRIQTLTWKFGWKFLKAFPVYNILVEISVFKFDWRCFFKDLMYIFLFTLVAKGCNFMKSLHSYEAC